MSSSLTTALLTIWPDQRGKVENCPLHGIHCKVQPIRILAWSHAGIPDKNLKVQYM